MGRHPDLDPRRVRPDWVYVGTQEAAVLGGVSKDRIRRWIASGELVGARVPAIGYGSYPRTVYRLSDVLALAANRRR